MQVNVRFLDNLKLEASFDNFSIISDQPIRYKGDGTAPGPYDYFLASSALCAAYFVKVYCNARNIPTNDIKVTQNNTVDPENRYKQDLHLQIELPASISDKDREGILLAMDRCTVKRVIQNNPNFVIEPKEILGQGADIDYTQYSEADFKTQIKGKDCTLEETIMTMRKIISDLGINIEIASWRNPAPHIWSVHIRDADSPMCFTNGKGTTKDAALCSALGEYLERISNNNFYNDYYLGEDLAHADFVHYAEEKWFKPEGINEIPAGLMDEHLLEIYGNDGELNASHLYDTNSQNTERGICALPFIRQSDNKTVYIPVNLIGNLFGSNGMSAGNTMSEARVQCLSEIFERAVKSQIILEHITLPDVPSDVLALYPHIVEAIASIEEKGFPVLVKDASLGGRFPVMCVTLMNPKNGGVFASFGSHPNFEVALERTLTELLQGRSFEGLNDTIPPTFNDFAVSEHNNIVDHFIDSNGVISWKFFSSQSDYEFHHWNFTGTTEEECQYLMDILKQLEKEVYIAEYKDLGANTCRIIVPDYSEIYLPEDLIWDNNNKAFDYRQDILNLHQLDDRALNQLIKKFERSELDDMMLISELINVAFDENSAWARVTISELKCLIFLALKKYEEAKDLAEMFINFNDSTVERRRFFQLLNVILDITIDEELEISDYNTNLTRMYGSELLDTVVKCVSGEIRFYGLTETNMKLIGLDKHIRLIESYKKLLNARRAYHQR